MTIASPTPDRQLPTPETLSVFWDPDHTSDLKHRITFRFSASEEWSFPRGHLLGYESATLDCAVLKFATHTIQMRGDSSREVLERIHSGGVALVVKGNATLQPASTTAYVQNLELVETKKQYDIP